MVTAARRSARHAADTRVSLRTLACHRGASQRMPGWLRRAAFVYLARLLCVKIPYSTHQAPHHLDVSRLRVPVTRNGLNLQEWILTEDKNGEGWTFRE